MTPLKESILKSLWRENSIRTVPHLADKMGVKVDMPFLEALYQLRFAKLITWKPGKYLHLSPKGYQVLEEALDETA